MNPRQYALHSLNAMDQYIDDVINGNVVTGRLEKLSVERHVNDLMNGGERGLIFDEVAVAHYFQFFSFLKHSKGIWSGKQIVLEGWQCFTKAMIYGWKLESTGGRRFKEVYEKVARKNGKTTMMCGPGLYGLTKDNEGGPEVYAAATKRDQAKLLFKEAKSMVQKCPELKKRLDVRINEVLNHGNDGLFVPLSSESGTMDGLNPHIAMIDEVHAHKTAELYDVIKSAFGSRLQGLLISITTEGWIRESINDQLHDYAVGILDGNIQDDSFFSIIFTMDEGDDYFDESNWRKANPNLGVSISLDYLRDMSKHAQKMPSQRANFLTKHLNVRVNASQSWVDVDAWKRCASEYTLQDMAECTAVYGGLDLASVGDITSLGLIGEMPDGTLRTWSINWLPEDAVLKRANSSRVPYIAWAAAGWLETTPGNVADYAFIRQAVNQVAGLVNLQAVAFDDWNSSQLVTELLDDGINMLSMRQGYKSISPAMKELERRYVGGTLRHSNNPVLNWAMGNVVATKDPAGNIKADKSKAQEKIDPALGLIMAMGALMNEPVEEAINIVIG